MEVKIRDTRWLLPHWLVCIYYDIQYVDLWTFCFLNNRTSPCLMCRGEMKNLSTRKSLCRDWWCRVDAILKFDARAISSAYYCARNIWSAKLGNIILYAKILTFIMAIDATPFQQLIFLSFNIDSFRRQQLLASINSTPINTTPNSRPIAHDGVYWSNRSENFFRWRIF